VVRTARSWKPRALVAAACLAALTGCVSMPSTGPVLPYKVTQSNADSSSEYLQVTSAPPGADWNPVQIVQGFLDANASFADNHNAARDYLTPAAARIWLPKSADVYSGSPSVQVISGGGRTDRVAQVEVSAKVQESVTAGVYPAPTPAHGNWSATLTLRRSPEGQWRIAQPPPDLLLSAVEFLADYQSRNLYFFDPTGSTLVPDPVYEPLQTARADPGSLLYVLVRDLMPDNKPDDWLGSATQTAFPDGSKLLGVTLQDGTATVNLGGSIMTARPHVLEQVSAQLLSTLIGASNSAPAVQSVAVYRDGKPWSPPGSGNDPVQQPDQYPQFGPAKGSSTDLYYLDSSGNVWHRNGPTGRATRVFTWTRGEPVLSSIAVSRDKHFLAGLSGGSVYVGRMGGPLTRRISGGFTSMSWDASDQLWISSPSDVEMLRAAGGSPETVNFPLPDLITAMRVAPDGVRVAFVLDGTQVAFGAIIQNPSGKLAGATIAMSQFSVPGTKISDLSWYGPDNVIVLSDNALTEYPVNGSTATTLVRPAGMVNVTASLGSPLAATLTNGQLVYNPSVNGSWVSLGATGSDIVYPG
jgi:hypothetical protein